MDDLTTRLLSAGAAMDQADESAWIEMLRQRGENLEMRARAIAGYPAEITEEVVLSVEALVAKAAEEREAERIASEEAKAWDEYAQGSRTAAAAGK